jgi:hypothetical protein
VVSPAVTAQDEGTAHEREVVYATGVEFPLDLLGVLAQLDLIAVDRSVVPAVLLSEPLGRLAGYGFLLHGIGRIVRAGTGCMSFGCR